MLRKFHRLAVKFLKGSFKNLTMEVRPLIVSCDSDTTVSGGVG